MYSFEWLLKIHSTHQSTYFIYYLHQDKLKIQLSSKCIKYFRSYQEDMIELLEEIDYIYISFEFQVGIGFSGQLMTQHTCQSHVNVNHVRT